MYGKVRFYDPRAGWGMIVTDDSTGYFLNGRDYDGGAFPGPMPGEQVTFELRRSPKGRQAVGVKQVKQ